MDCSNVLIGSILYIVHNIINVIWIVGPILCIISIVYSFIMLMKDPDNKKAKPRIKNSFMALLFLFFIPLLVNVLFNVIGEDFSSCWNGNYRNNFGNSTYIDIYGNDKKQVINDYSYENGKKREDNNNSNNNGDNNSNLNSNESNNSTSYSNIHILNTFTLNDFMKVVDVKSCNGYTTVQSLAVSSNYYVVGNIRGNDNSCVQIYNKSGKRLNTINSHFYHFNGMTYNDNLDTVFVSTMDGGRIDYFKINNLVSGSNLDKRTFNFSKAVSAISYDKSNNKYYFAKGGSLYVTDSNFKVLNTFKKIRSETPQDIGSYNGVIYVICYFSSKSSSAIDLYRSSDGKYIGTYMINNSHEIESLAYDYSSNLFAILVNGGVDSIYTTNKLVIP